MRSPPEVAGRDIPSAPDALSDAASYSLDALEGGERDDFERAMTGSAALRREVAGFLRVAAQLALLTHPARPSPAFTQTVAALVAGDTP